MNEFTEQDNTITREQVIRTHEDLDFESLSEFEIARLCSKTWSMEQD